MSRYPALTAFFRTFGSGSRIQVLETDPAAFASELHVWLKRRPPVAARDTDTPARPADEKKGSIFISYVREDLEAARRLYDAVTKIGGDVWLDERRLMPGDRWEEEILTSIRRDIRLFLPMISKHTESREEGYIFKEWREAVERARGIPPGGRRFIVPIVIDADYDGDPSHYRQVPEAFTTPHWGYAPDGEPDPHLISALTVAIREDINWIQANEYAKKLRLGGYSNRRLPIDELEKVSSALSFIARVQARPLYRWSCEVSRGGPNVVEISSFVGAVAYLADVIFRLATCPP